MRVQFSSYIYFEGKREKTSFGQCDHNESESCTKWKEVEIFTNFSLINNPDRGVFWFYWYHLFLKIMDE
jgi:hypothetical protein